MGADSGHHEHRSPSTRASSCRRRRSCGMACRSMAFVGQTPPRSSEAAEPRSHIRRRGLRRRRECVQTEDSRHGRRFRAPRALQPEHEGGDRGEGMAVDLPQINCPARPAARAEHVEPRRPCDQRSPDRRRPQHVPARSQLLIPALDDGLRLGARRRIGNLPLGIGGNVQAPASARPSLQDPEIGQGCFAAGAQARAVRHALRRAGSNPRG